ncbi:MAG TPA: hypothetical protein VHJ83_11970 [Micromonosporaceae bacterium]|nr:hypothetical protein [Micromonosporaceae bacterium]
MTDHQGNSSRPSLCLAIDTDDPIKLALHWLSGSDVVVYVRLGPVQPIRSRSTTLGRLTDHSSRAIRWVQQFAGVVLPLAEIVVLLVAVMLLIIGEIGVDLLLSQLR